MDARSFNHRPFDRSLPTSQNAPEQPSLVPPISQRIYPVRRYHLELTLTCGQAFRWTPIEHSWVGAVGEHWIRIGQDRASLIIETTHSNPNWELIEQYFQIHLDIDAITAQFPTDQHLSRAESMCRGLRLLRQPKWECLASFILSSTKQIPHIQRLTASLAEEFGKPLTVPPNHPPAFTFPTPETLATISEQHLRSLGLGYRAPYLRDTARMIAQGQVSLEEIASLPYQEARKQLETLPGVGPKIADCALLFAYGEQQAFPIDVWVQRALSELYFSTDTPSRRELETFAASYFAPFGGYAQQYLFHYMRTAHGRQRRQSPINDHQR